MDNTQPETGLESHGPFETYKLTINGFKIPHLTGRLIDGMWHFNLDGRFACDVPEMYGLGAAWMIANAMAVGAGYSCFGENSQLLNPFKTRLHRVSMAIEDDRPCDTTELADQ